MNAALTYVAQLEHFNDLRAAAAESRRSPRQPRRKRRLQLRSGLRRARRALAA